MSTLADDLCAGIDIGTNTILMVIGRRRPDGTVDTIRDEHAIARLGEGLGQTGRISDAAVARAVAILLEYRAILDTLHVTTINAVATSAMRDAANASDVRQILEHTLRAPIVVIDGAEEARLTFLGTVGRSPAPCIVLDIGGGSTEVAAGINGVVTTSASVQMGVVRLTERHLAHKPPTSEQIAMARDDVRTALHDALPVPPQGALYAVAGTPVALAALDLGLQDHDQARIVGHLLTKDAVDRHVERLLASTIDELRMLPGVHPLRADVLPAGALILQAAMHMLSATSCTVSTRGLRFGAMLGR